MKTTALGLIEVKGYIGAIEASDAALKAANVKLVKLEKIGHGLVTTMLTGDVGAVRAAVDAGTTAAAKCSTVLSSQVIPRLHEETMGMIFIEKQPPVNPEPVEVEVTSKPSKDQSAHETENVETDSEPILGIAGVIEGMEVELQVLENTSELKEEQERESSSSPEIEQEQVIVNVQEPEDKPTPIDAPLSLHGEELEHLKVEELRKLVRTLRLKNVKPNEIKFGRKEFLIEVINEYYREEEGK